MTSWNSSCPMISSHQRDEGTTRHLVTNGTGPGEAIFPDRLTTGWVDGNCRIIELPFMRQMKTMRSPAVQVLRG